MINSRTSTYILYRYYYNIVLYLCVIFIVKFLLNYYSHYKLRLIYLVAYFNIMNNSQASMAESINGLNITENNLARDVDDLAVEYSKLTINNTYLNNKVMALENKIESLEQYIISSPNIPQSDLINEIMNRLSRARNIIIYELKEVNSSSDSEHLQAIFKLMKLNIESVRFVRLGKYSERTRPLKVTFDDTVNVIEVLNIQNILRSSSKYKNIRFSADRTPKQREQMASLRKELQFRRQNGEPNIVIKFIKGNPVIVH